MLFMMLGLLLLLRSIRNVDYIILGIRYDYRGCIFILFTSRIYIYVMKAYCNNNSREGKSILLGFDISTIFGKIILSHDSIQ